MKPIKLESNDGKIIEVDTQIAKQSVTISTMLDSLSQDANEDEDPISLPNVTSATLSKVITWCTHHKDDPPPPEDDENKERRTDDIPAWDQEFLKVDQGTLFELMLAANYLDIRGLLDVCCKTVANMIKGKSPEEIRKTFNIQRDFNATEEELIAFLVNEIDDQGFSCIYYSLCNEFFTLCEILISYGANLNRDQNGTSLLHLMLAMDNYASATFLIMHGCEVNSLDSATSWTPLHLLVSKKNEAPIEIVENLLKNGARVDIIDSCGNSVLHLAIENNNFSAFKLFLDQADGSAMSVQNHEGLWPMLLAFLTQYSSNIKCPAPFADFALEKKDVDVNVNFFFSLGRSCDKFENGDTLLMALIRCQCHEGIKQLLLCPRLDVNRVNAVDESTALHVAIDTDSQSLALLLASAGADPNAIRKHLIPISSKSDVAISNPFDDELLCDRIAPDGASSQASSGLESELVEDLKTPLHLAMEKQMSEVIEFFLQESKISSVALDNVDCEGDNLLAKALWTGQTALTEKILVGCASIDSKRLLFDPRSKRPNLLSRAIERCNTAAVELLLKFCSPEDFKDSSPLYLAIIKARNGEFASSEVTVSIIEKLCNALFDPNEFLPDGTTLLWLALCMGRFDIADILVMDFFL
ncbi:suppressor of kinetochore protein mutant [Cichlidogyrus casuarinus]|uniref:S-phase kinase-associated protein 1 n=1 Tax=Cichlidogyrus casuarinus TaxID=1844966 RepID=A0ABD2QE16_9PLAT